MSIFSTPDQITVYRICVLKSALRLLSKGIKPNRSYTMKACLASASDLTGHAYPISRAACLKAIEDIEQGLRKVIAQ